MNKTDMTKNNEYGVFGIRITSFQIVKKFYEQQNLRRLIKDIKRAHLEKSVLLLFGKAAMKFIVVKDSETVLGYGYPVKANQNTFRA